MRRFNFKYFYGLINFDIFKVIYIIYLLFKLYKITVLQQRSLKFSHDFIGHKSFPLKLMKLLLLISMVVYSLTSISCIS